MAWDQAWFGMQEGTDVELDFPLIVNQPTSRIGTFHSLFRSFLIQVYSYFLNIECL